MNTELVVVERMFEEPTPFADLETREATSRWCLDSHRVRPLMSYVASSSRIVVCFYEAPDAEAVRLAQVEADMPYTHIWGAQTIRFAPGDEARTGWSSVIAQREMPVQATEEMFRENARHGASCLTLHRSAHLVSYLSRDGLRSVCLFEAPDAESIRIASRQAQMPLHNVWQATLHRA